jgi:hypothetical protein
MSQSYGYNFSLGVGVETTYGTAVAPTSFMEVTEESLNYKNGVKARTVLGKSYSDAYVGEKQSVDGSISWPATYQNAAEETLLKSAFGACSSAISTGVVYDHTFTLSDALTERGLSVYVDTDSTHLGGTTAQQFVGCGVSSLKISQSVEGYLSLSADIVGKGHNLIARVTPSIPSFKGVTWDQVSSLTIGGTAYNARVTEFQIDNSLASDRFNLGSRQRVGLGRGGVRKVSGKVSIELADTALLTAFKAGTEVAISCVWTGALAGSSLNYSKTLTLPRCILTADVPSVKDVGPIVIDYPFTAFAVEGQGNEIQLVCRNLSTAVA